VRLLITGHGGLLAGAVFRAGTDAGADVVGLTEQELDITDAAAVARALEEVRPDVVINCAAWVNAETAEDDPDGARAVNADGAGILAAAADAVGSAIVYPSTDYVFDGTKGEAYVETDAPAPLSVYGETKLAGERATAEANPRHFVTRTAWLYGPGGRNFPDTMLKLAADGADIRVVDDQIGCPTYTGHLAEALVELAGTENYGTHHMGGGTVCSWYELAREVFRLSGSDYPVRPCTSAEYPLQAPRPAFSALTSERTDTPRLPPLEAGLRAHLETRAAV
jgi:dTDP-4-dehydrorhamnose reductase